MNSVAIAGASGVVGRRALEYVLARNDVDRVVAIGRRMLPVQHDKLVSKIVDMGSEQAMMTEIPDGITVALCCLGTTMKQAGSKEAFRAVDRDAIVSFAKAALERGAKRFAVVTAVGANPRARSFYLRTKGEAEEALARLGFAQLTVLRPSFIDDEGARGEYRVAERILLPVTRLLFSVVAKKSRYAPITADALGKALVRFAFDDSSERVRIVEGPQLHDAGR